jgi:hypothetical protein
MLTMMTITMTTTTATIAIFRKRNTNGALGPLNFSIGMYGPGGSEFSNAQISYMLAYTRVLSDIEIKQCHNALKSRFGL